MTQCPNCGALQPENSVFCQSCGASLNARQPNEQPVYGDRQPAFDMPGAAPAYGQPQPGAGQPYEQPAPQPGYGAPAGPDVPKKSGGKNPAIAVVAVLLAVLLVGGGVFAWIMLRGKDETDSGGTSKKRKNSEQASQTADEETYTADRNREPSADGTTGERQGEDIADATGERQREDASDTTAYLPPEEATEAQSADWTTAPPDQLFRPDPDLFIDQYSAYVFCIDTDVQDFVKMRFGPSKSRFNTVGVVIPNYNTVIVETASVNGWTLCFYNGTEGWIRSDFLFVSYDDIPGEECEVIDGVGDKPVLYLYPESTRQVSVKIGLSPSFRFDCTYPAYADGWNVIAAPDGTLTNLSDGKEYSYLFWDLVGKADYDFSSGFVVKGEDTAAFLQETLAAMGLAPAEANEFIVYWLPKMQKNPYNLISFQTDRYTDNVKLEISPEPDSILRVFMAYKRLDAPVSVPAQEIRPFERVGFTAVEWGGAEVRTAVD